MFYTSNYRQAKKPPKFGIPKIKTFFTIPLPVVSLIVGFPQGGVHFWPKSSKKVEKNSGSQGTAGNRLGMAPRDPTGHGGSKKNYSGVIRYDFS